MNKWKSKSFYIVLISAVVLVVQAFGVKVDVPYVSEIVGALCALGVVLGILVDDKNASGVESVEKELEKTEFTAFDVHSYKKSQSTAEIESIETSNISPTTETDSLETETENF